MKELTTSMMRILTAGRKNDKNETHNIAAPQNYETLFPNGKVNMFFPKYFLLCSDMVPLLGLMYREDTVFPRLLGMRKKISNYGDPCEKLYKDCFAKLRVEG